MERPEEQGLSTLCKRNHCFPVLREWLQRGQFLFFKEPHNKVIKQWVQVMLAEVHIDVKIKNTL